ncbi:hypothetical protein [Anaerococcus sp. Marseille-P3625]|uniref:hypothetical protein n=1 Tax=Anaerococcus sp. Marseille-P3625 TaxID=1977277 RepID=UPI000C082D1C|nr:hypothetical protein [Anaerococcus sp. Marseille-P3625]
MTDQREKIREFNIIWDFSHNYKFTPKKTYPMDEVYKNMVQGFIIKTFDLKMLDSFFAYLKKDNPFYEDFVFITNLLIEEISYKELAKENLVIEDFKKDYARKKLRKYSYHQPNNLKEQIEKAYYDKVFGKPIIEGALFREIYREIFAINTTDTNILIDKLNKVFKSHFKFERGKKDQGLFEEMVKENKAKDFKDSEKSKEFSEDLIREQFAIGSAEFTGNIYLAEKKKDLDKNLLFLNSSDDNYHSSDQFIEDFFGKSILAKEKLHAIEKTVAKGIHSGKKLYFTKGEYSDKANAKFYKKNRQKQYDKNKNYIENNFAINNRNINELSLAIKNSLLTYEDFVDVRKNYGEIDSSKVWKAPILNDYDVFKNQELDNVNKFKIDLLIDSSASQIKRQEILANQAYIIGKSMDKVGIPIRIMGFSSLRDHTIFNLYRDYQEKNKNLEIYNFYAAGSNRDGFAFKTIHELIKKESDTKNILIILSDGKPNDKRSNINTKKLKEKDQYQGKIAVDDTAFEIRNLKNDGISILAVFTGEDEDVKNAKLIYNKDFVRITKLENFSKIVSIFIKNEILNN